MNDFQSDAAGTIPVAEGVRDETLYRDEHTWLFRRHLADGAGSFLCKQPLGPDAVQRLRHELRMLARLAGIEGVPQLYAGVAPDNVIALQVELDTVTVAEALRRTPLELPPLLPFALTLTRILAAMHRAGVFHRNINPSNVLLAGPQHKAMLINFQLATSIAEEQPGFTHHSEILGKLAYLAPEQTGRTGRTVDQRADLYALGATLYEFATGQPPFAARDPLQLIHQLLAQAPTPPTDLNPRLSAQFSAIVMRLLEKEPDRRYQSADGLVHDLSRLREAPTQDASEPFELGQHDFPLRLLPPSRLVGRDAEVTALQSAFDSVLGSRSRGVLVTGAPGVGKTALINTLRPYVTARRGWMVYGKFDQFRQDIETDAITQALRALGRLLLAEPEQALAEQRAYLLRVLCPRAAVIASLLPEFALLLGVAPADPSVDLAKAVTQESPDGMTLLRAIASSARPLVIVIDDLQWAASTPFGFIDAVLTDETLTNVLIVVAYRDTEVDATHALSAALARWNRLPMPPLHLQLQNLPPSDLSMLLAEMLRLPSTQAASLADAVNVHTGGNPYDTVEFINALRHEKMLLPGESGWDWDAATIRRFVGQGEVQDLLLARLKRLPLQAQVLLQMIACVGGEVSLNLLRIASDLPALAVDEHLAPALEDGLLLMDRTGDDAVRFRHDRVQQAAYASLDSGSRRNLHLVLARRFAAVRSIELLAAEQYLRAVEAVQDPGECRTVARLFRDAAAHLKLMNLAATEQFLSAASTLLSSIPASTEDESLLTALGIERHAALCNLGRFEEADRVYESIERDCRDLMQLSESAGVQISSLNSRNLLPEALAFGLGMLQKLGLKMPEGNVDFDIARRLDNLCRWIDQSDVIGEQQRPEVSDPAVVAAAKLIYRLLPAANKCNSPSKVWLVLEAQRLWAEHGACAALAGPVGHVAFVTIDTRQDYRHGYAAVRHVLALSEARGYEPATSLVRFLFAFSASHWFEPLENSVLQLQRAREGLLQGGDFQNACFAYMPSIVALLDCAPSLEICETEIEAGIALATRTGNELATAPFIAHRQLLRALRGETTELGGFTDASFDEPTYLASPGAQYFDGAIYHLTRGLAAALFGDSSGLARHAAAAMSLLPYIQSGYRSSLTHLLQALALAERIKTAAEDRIAMLSEFDACRDWLARRAADCPDNFLHLLKWVEAERAWATNDFQAAVCAFDAALRAVEPRQRPWHRALLTERAALFHLKHGLEHSGQMLLSEARRLYENWGASRKVQELERAHTFLRGVHSAPQHRVQRDASASVDTLDMLAILRASQTLSSETSLPRLQARVVELLSAMTGATQVQLVLRRDEPPAWVLSPANDPDAAPITVDEGGHLLPLSAFHYAARTLEPLLVEDATHDDRFAHDPYLAALERCSLLLVPILSKGEPRALLVIENRLSRSAFSAARLDAVKLVAGQLAVSLENALFYEELEQRVAKRTTELANSLSLLNATLESSTDGIVAFQFGGGAACYNTQYRTMWGMPAELLENSSDFIKRIEWIAAQTVDPQGYIDRQLGIEARRETEAFEVIQLKDGRTIEHLMKPQKIDAQIVGVVISFRDITERKRAEKELEAIHRKLLDTSRQAGMAEVASNVLHNVGNVLNSVNVSANLVAENMKHSKVANLAKVAGLLHEHAQNLAAFIANDPKGKHLPGFLAQLCEHLLNEQHAAVKELDSLRKNIDHIKEIVTMQQSYSKVSGVKEIVNIDDLIEDALHMNSGALQRHRVEIVREFAAAPKLNTEKHKILQILVNLVRNAKYACSESQRSDKRVTLRVTHNDDWIKIAVIDNGVGISAENLTRIFGHGFTTRKDGHGFGLHSGALAAKELGGALTVRSDGVGLGACFTLELPVDADGNSKP